MNVNCCYKYFIDSKETFCSTKTIENYMEHMNYFFDFLKVFFGRDLEQISVDDLSVDVLRNYILSLRERDISNVSIETYFRTVKVFFSYLVEYDYIPSNLCLKVKIPKAYPKEKLPLTVSDVELIDFHLDLNDEMGMRNYLIVHFMLDCGLRLSEVVGMRLSWIDFAHSLISVIGKGTKNRLVPIPQQLLSVLNTYIIFYAHDSELIFYSFYGKALTEKAVQSMLYKLKVKTGIERLHAHLFRHTFATSYIMGGGNVEFLRILMGHSDIQTTQNYIHISNNCLLLGIEVYHLDSMFFNLFKY